MNYSEESPEKLTSSLRDLYRIERKIGQGGMATVYLAEDLKHHRKVALKVLTPELSAILGPERFLKEIEVTASLQHPHILPLYDSGRAGPYLYYVMPYVEGESLQDRLDRERQLPLEDVIAVAESVAAALDYAHDRGVVHRDVKPANVLFQGGAALVADFGIAVAVAAAGDTRLTETGLSVGTPDYMSPEQAMGERKLDARSDVYSLGAMVYEMLVGEPPHLGSSAQAVVAKILTDTPVPVRRTRDMVPRNVDAAVQKALARNPADRFRSAGDFAAALKNPTFTLPSLASESALGEAKKWQRLGLLGVALGLSAVALAVGVWVGDRTPAPVTRSLMGFPHEESPMPTWGESVAISPDGRTLAYIGPGEEQTAVWVRSRENLHATRLDATEGAFQVFFDPSGQDLAFLNYEGNREALRRISLSGGVPRTIGVRDFWGMVSWGQDGFFYAADTRESFRVPEDGGSEEALLRAEEGGIKPFSARLLPNEQGVLLVLRDQAGDSVSWEIGLLDLRTREHRILTPGVGAWYADTGELLILKRNGTLVGARFPVDEMVVTGPEVPLLENVAIDLAENASYAYAEGVYDLDLSKNGTLIYRSAPGRATYHEAVWVSRSGRATPVDPNWQFDPAGGGLSLSPDGSRLAVGMNTEAGADIWVKRLDRGPLNRVTFFPGRDTRPAWTEDGQSILYISQRGEDPVGELFAARGDGAGEPELVVSEAPRLIGEASGSLRSGWLVFRTGSAGLLGGQDIYAIPPGEDSEPIPILATDFNERGPALSPDGRWIAYVSDETGQAEVFVRPFPNADDAKWKVSLDGGSPPAWSHSGQELFYVDSRARMMVVRVQLESGLEPEEPTPLFDLDPGVVISGQVPSFDVSLDDQRFLMVRNLSGEGSGSYFVLVDNWCKEVEREVEG